MNVLTYFLTPAQTEKYMKRYPWLGSFEVQKWLNSIYVRARGKHGFSYASFRVHVLRMNTYITYTCLSPEALIDEIENDEARPLRQRMNPAGIRIKRFYSYLIEKMAPKTAEAYCNTVRGFYKHNGFIVKVHIPTGANKKVKYPLTKEIVKAVLMNTPTLRDKVIILIQCCSGMSITDVLDLCYRDIKAELESDKFPLLIDFNRVKNNRHYKTFLSRECIFLLKQYLAQERKSINSDDFLFTNVYGRQLSYRAFLRVMNRISKRTIGDTRINTKAFRRFFSTQMKMAGVSSDIVEYWMGHSLGVKSDYLDPERLRSIYEEKEDAVTIMTTVIKLRADEVRKEIEKEFEQKITQLGRRLDDVLNLVREIEKREQD